MTSVSHRLAGAGCIVLLAIVTLHPAHAVMASMSVRDHANAVLGRKLQGVKCHEDRCGIYCGPPRPPPCGDDYSGRLYDDDDDNDDDHNLYNYHKADDARYDLKALDRYNYKPGAQPGPYQDGTKADAYPHGSKPGHYGPAYKQAAGDVYEEYDQYAPRDFSQQHYDGPYAGGATGNYGADRYEEKHVKYSDSADSYSDDKSEDYPPDKSDDSDDDSDDSQDDSGDSSEDYPSDKSDSNDDSDDSHDDDYREPGCYGSLPFGLENCVCDGAEIGQVAGTAACGRVFTECQGMAAFHVEDGQLGAIQRTCDTLALDSCVGAAQNALVDNPGCAELLRFGTPKCTPGEASQIFKKSVRRQCKPLCKKCVRHDPYKKKYN